MTHSCSIQPVLWHFTSTQQIVTCLTIPSRISPPSCSPSSLGKSNFLFHLFCLHMFQRVIPNQSSSLYTVSSTTLDLPQLAGCNPKFYMEMCESILLAPEVQQTPASFKKKQACVLNHTFQDLRNMIW